MCVNDVCVIKLNNGLNGKWMDGKWIEWMWKVDVESECGKWRGSGSHTCGENPWHNEIKLGPL